MFIESSSFAASAVTGTIFVNAGLAILIFATPVGWMGLVMGGIAVAGVAATASIAVNYGAIENAGDLYDSIMNEINH